MNSLMPVPQDQIHAAANGMTWEAYMELFTRLVAEGRTTGTDQSEALLAYTKLNLSRSRRWLKTLKLLPEVQDGLPAAAPQTWLVITEAWCGDAAQCNPIIAAMAERTPGVTLRFILRDEHLPIMDRYLTNGGRSIPKLIVWDDATKEELYNWGPRPADAQVLYTDYLATPVDQRDAEAMKEKLHRWYFDDAGVSVQQELLALAKRTVQVKA
jgi:hypothetical protein